MFTACASVNLVPTQAPVMRLEEVHGLGATRVEFDAAGERIATGGHLGEVYVWEIPEGRRTQTLSRHTGLVRGLAWLDDNTLVSAAEDGLILVWDVRAQEVSYSTKTSPVTALVYVPSRRQLITGHVDGLVRSWAYPSLQGVSSHALGGRVLSVAVSADGAQLAASNDRTDVVLLTPGLDSPRVLPSRDKVAQELRFSPDGRQLAAGTWFDLMFWDLATGRVTVTETEHIGAIISVDYTPDGSRLVSLGRHTDANIRLLNVRSGEMERRLRAHNLCGYSIRISPDGRYVASVSEDESIRLYDLSTPYEPTWGE